MKAIQIDYKEARKLMKPGDVIAFGGKTLFSEIIKLATFSNVSHVGAILQTNICDDNTGRFFNKIIESASINGFNGVSDSRLSERLNDVEGEIWWLPLKKEIREHQFNQEKFYNFLFDQDNARVEYDLAQALMSAMDIFDKLPLISNNLGHNKEDFNKFFCSELIAAAFEKSGITGDINASEVTPIDLCRWSLYEDNYYQLKGDNSREIKVYSSIKTSVHSK